MNTAARLAIETVPLDQLAPYEGNAKAHPASQVAQIAASIERFGNCDPIGVWTEPETDRLVIVEGHGRLEALKMLGATDAPVIRLDHLTEAERRAYTIAHNQLTMNTGWDLEALEVELEALTGADGFELADLGFQILAGDGADAAELASTQSTADYDEFLDKFKPKRTTDDCYTPENVYAAVLEWARVRYEIDPAAPIVRPFYPGGDYRHEDYPAGSIVIDNPPFSILSEIVDHYQATGQPFLLFCPGLVLSGVKSGITRVCIYPQIEYDNGASVPTGFVTNMTPDLAAETAPELDDAIRAANKANTGGKAKPKRLYPAALVTAAALNRWSRYGIEFKIPAAEAVKVSKLDNQLEGEDVYGAGLLLSQRMTEAAARAEATARAEAAARATEDENTIKLSDRERQLIANLGGGHHAEPEAD